jgi:hypothetical protein
MGWKNGIPSTEYIPEMYVPGQLQFGTWLESTPYKLQTSAVLLDEPHTFRAIKLKLPSPPGVFASSVSEPVAHLPLATLSSYVRSFYSVLRRPHLNRIWLGFLCAFLF